MEKDGVIEKVTVSTEWVNSIVCVNKMGRDGKLKVRFCLDPHELNKNIKREQYYSKKIDEISPRLQGKKISSAVECKRKY
jgi:hypothetical protein